MPTARLLRRAGLDSLAAWAIRRRAVRRSRGAPPPAPFVVGATRSGTTLLRLMLDAHPQLAIPSETHFIPELVEACADGRATPEHLLELLTSHRRWGDFQLDAGELEQRIRALDELSATSLTRAFFDLYAERQGKSRWGDKTPGYVKQMRTIQNHVPEARFIHLIRDGRDVALSVLRQSFGPQTIEAAAERWRERIGRGRAQVPFLGHYLEVHFEDLVTDTEPTLRRICEFAELPYDPTMLAYHERAAERLQEKARDLPRRHGESQPAAARLRSHEKTSEPPNPELIGRWRTEMSAADRRAYEQVAGELLAELGYEVGDAAVVAAAAETASRSRSGRRGGRLLRAAHARGLRIAGSGPPEAEIPPPAPFLVGVARSGTALLRAMLAAHPQLVIPPPTGFVPALAETIRSEPVTPERVVRLIAASRPVADYGLTEEELTERLRGLEELKAAPVLRTFYAAVAERAGTERWGDETSAYLQRMHRIQRALSEARFVHVVRDGRDVAAARPGDGGAGRAIRMARRWTKRIAAARETADRIDHYTEVRYEDLVADPQGTLRRLCEWLELPWEPAITDPPDRAAIEAELGPPGGWRTALDDAERAAYEEVAGRLLAELGYEVGLPSGVAAR